MPARGSLYQLLDRDRQLGALGFDAVYHANTVDTPPEQRFLVIKFESQAKAFGPRGPETCTVWAYDKANEHYENIDRALVRVVEVVSMATHLVGPDGWTLTTADWRSFGPDLKDEGYDALARWAEFRVVSRYGSP